MKLEIIKVAGDLLAITDKNGFSDIVEGKFKPQWEQIVSTVNLHDELIEMLKELKGYIIDQGHCGYIDEINELLIRDYEQPTGNMAKE